MYNRHLNTFICVADHGSFSKAAEVMFITPTAVTKQINLLEDSLGLRLFRRTYHGLSLTESGKIVYAGAKELIALSDDIGRRARAAEERRGRVIRIGMFQVDPLYLRMNPWFQAAAAPDIRLEMAFFPDSGAGMQRMLDSLGRDIDLFAGPTELPSPGDGLAVFHLLSLPAMVILSQKHPLAKAGRLTPDDLRGTTLLATPWSCSHLRMTLPGVNLKCVELSDVRPFNHLADSDELLFGAEHWHGLHPQLAAVPVDWSCTIRYGLVTTKEPPETVRNFIAATQNAAETQNPF